MDLIHALFPLVEAKNLPERTPPPSPRPTGSQNRDLNLHHGTSTSRIILHGPRKWSDRTGAPISGGAAPARPAGTGFFGKIADRPPPRPPPPRAGGAAGPCPARSHPAASLSATPRAPGGKRQIRVGRRLRGREHDHPASGRRHAEPVERVIPRLNHLPPPPTCATSRWFADTVSGSGRSAPANRQRTGVSCPSPSCALRSCRAAGSEPPAVRGDWSDHTAPRSCSAGAVTSRLTGVTRLHERLELPAAVSAAHPASVA